MREEWGERGGLEGDLGGLSPVAMYILGLVYTFYSLTAQSGGCQGKRDGADWWTTWAFVGAKHCATRQLSPRLPPKTQWSVGP